MRGFTNTKDLSQRLCIPNDFGFTFDNERRGKVHKIRIPGDQAGPMFLVERKQPPPDCSKTCTAWRSLPCLRRQSLPQPASLAQVSLQVFGSEFRVRQNHPPRSHDPLSLEIVDDAIPRRFLVPSRTTGHGGVVRKFGAY